MNGDGADVEAFHWVVGEKAPMHGRQPRVQNGRHVLHRNSCTALAVLSAKQPLGVRRPSTGLGRQQTLGMRNRINEPEYPISTEAVQKVVPNFRPQDSTAQNTQQATIDYQVGGKVLPDSATFRLFSTAPANCGHSAYINRLLAEPKRTPNTFDVQ